MRLPSKDVANHYRLLADQYVQSSGCTEYELIDVVQWAMARGELELSPDDIAEIHRDRLGEALRTDVTKDAAGRKVRLRHCVQMILNGNERDPKQRCLWAHLDDARDEFLWESLNQRRSRIRADVEQLRADLDYINARRAARGLNPIQMSFDFTSEGSAGRTG